MQPPTLFDFGKYFDAYLDFILTILHLVIVYVLIMIPLIIYFFAGLKAGKIEREKE